MPVQWNGDEAARRIVTGAVKGLNKAATALQSESQSRVPVDSTDLRNSSATHDATPGDLVSAVTYNTPYAVIQHERLDFQHPTDHNPGAQAKYLEGPAVELRHKLGEIVGAEIRREVG